MIARLSIPGRWSLLIVGSILLGVLLTWARLPAAMLLGPLIAAICLQCTGGAVRVPPSLMIGAQTIVGCLVAQAITSAILVELARHWIIFLTVVLLSVAVAVAIGWTLSKLRVIPGSTAVWGILPGAGTVMMMMAEAYGADFRLVAFMQYLRVIIVATVASVVAALFMHGSGHSPTFHLVAPINPVNLAETAAIAVVGGMLGRITHMPAGLVMGPLILGAVLNVTGLVTIELPTLVLIASYTIIGWNTGLRFDREILAVAARALPQTILAIFLMMIFSGLLAWSLVEIMHVDPLTAYLATSPGSIDAAAVIAATTSVDRPFVMTLQTIRLIVLLFVGPLVARRVAESIDRANSANSPNS